MQIDLRLGDSLHALESVADNSVDSCVTDPPYALDSVRKRFGGANAAPARSDGPTGVYARASAGFMGQQWDTGERSFSDEFWREVYRVLKPGAFLLAFGGTRTYHRLGCAIEDAGFEIRDQIGWMFATGMPKSHDLFKALVKAGVPPLEAEEWVGWGTGLAPAWEPICVARKPGEGTNARNILKWGVGGLNIDGCRIEAETGRPWRQPSGLGVPLSGSVDGSLRNPIEDRSHFGRWPKNVIIDGSAEVIAFFPDSKDQQGDVRGTEASFTGAPGTNCYGEFGRVPFRKREDSGSAARFFYSAKASKADRNDGCEGMLQWGYEGLSQDILTALSHLKDISENTTLLPGEFDFGTMSFGSDSSARSLPDLISTIRTAIKLTTELQTWNCSADLSTSEFILDAIKQLTANGSNLAVVAEHIRQLIRDTTDERTESVLGVVLAVLKTLSPISERARRGNWHSTVKPTALMRYLCRLVTPPGGLVLDPFMGSGSTGRGAVLEGMSFLGIEAQAEYLTIAERRIAAVSSRPHDPLLVYLASMGVAA